MHTCPWRHTNNDAYDNPMFSISWLFLRDRVWKPMNVARTNVYNFTENLWRNNSYTQLKSLLHDTNDNNDTVDDPVITIASFLLWTETLHLVIYTVIIISLITQLKKPTYMQRMWAFILLHRSVAFGSNIASPLTHFHWNRKNTYLEVIWIVFLPNWHNLQS